MISKLSGLIVQLSQSSTSSEHALNMLSTCSAKGCNYMCVCVCVCVCVCGDGDGDGDDVVLQVFPVHFTMISA